MSEDRISNRRDRMTAMEACAVLWHLKATVEAELLRARAASNQAAYGPDDPHGVEIERLEKRVAALELAGAALTRSE